MPRLAQRVRSWSLVVGLVACTCGAGHAEPVIAVASGLLDQAYASRLVDHSRFERTLAQLHAKDVELTPSERWRLRFLDAWETLYEGDEAKSEAMMREVIANASDHALVAKASTMLMLGLTFDKRYQEAFELANRLAVELPEIRDTDARFQVLGGLAQTLGEAGQTDIAVRYAQMAGAALPPGESACKPLVWQIEALFGGKRLTLSSSVLRRAIGVCLAARQPVFADTAQLYMGTLYLDAGQPRQALALLAHIGSGIEASRFSLNIQSILRERARAYAAIGNDATAKADALGVVGMNGPHEVNWWLMGAYQVLYQLAKKHGDAVAALAYYEKYAAQEKGYLDDISARAIAYQAVQQHVLAQKLETETLSRQNAELRMRQALDAKSAETNHLYLALLLAALAFGALWMFRLKRSQLRFQRLSRLDSLTAVLNRQHFMDEVGRALRQLERQRGEACMVFIDLDHFKRVNDTCGHATGDEVLRHVAATIRQHLRPGDLFGRLGGEEFGILLTACAGRQCVALAECVRQAIEAEPVRVDGADVPVSISLGLSSTDACGYDLRRLCKEADAALYQAKRRGRNCVVAGGDGPSTAQCTPISSTSNTSVAFGGTAPSAPRLP